MNPAVTRNIMIDIETFGPRPCGLILSIGAIAFSSDPADFAKGTLFSAKPEDCFYQVLNFDAAERETRFVKDPGIMAWWRDKQPEAYAKLCQLMHASKLDMEGLMASFLAWLKPYCEQGYNIIGNAPSFDLVLLENAAVVTGNTFPVPYRAETDYRTITDLIWGPTNKPRPGPADAHDALYDAKFQASVYANAISQIESWKAAARQQSLMVPAVNGPVWNSVKDKLPPVPETPYHPYLCVVAHSESGARSVRIVQFDRDAASFAYIPWLDARLVVTHWLPVDAVPLPAEAAASAVES